MTFDKLGLILVCKCAMNNQGIRDNFINVFNEAIRDLNSGYTDKKYNNKSISTLLDHLKKEGVDEILGSIRAENGKLLCTEKMNKYCCTASESWLLPLVPYDDLITPHSIKKYTLQIKINDHSFFATDLKICNFLVPGMDDKVSNWVTLKIQSETLHMAIKEIEEGVEKEKKIKQKITFYLICDGEEHLICNLVCKLAVDNVRNILQYESPHNSEEMRINFTLALSKLLKEEGSLIGENPITNTTVVPTAASSTTTTAPTTTDQLCRGLDNLGICKHQPISFELQFLLSLPNHEKAYKYSNKKYFVPMLPVQSLSDQKIYPECCMGVFIDGEFFSIYKRIQIQTIRLYEQDKGETNYISIYLKYETIYGIMKYLKSKNFENPSGRHEINFHLSFNKKNFLVCSILLHSNIKNTKESGPQHVRIVYEKKFGSFLEHLGSGF